MLYPIALEQGNENKAFGVVVPDLNGCFSAGDTFDEAVINAKAAIESHLELLAEDGEVPVKSGSIQEHHSKEEFKGWVWALVDVDIDAYLGCSSKINITLPDLLIKKIDRITSGANPTYKSRSQFLRLSALHEIEQVLNSEGKHV